MGNSSSQARRPLTSMGYRPDHPTIIYEDTQTAIKFIRSKEAHGRLKHIDIKHLFLVDMLMLMDLMLIRSIC
jgi:hypothetical protein